MKKIDTHQHLFYPDTLAYPWVGEAPALQGAFTVEDYRRAAEGMDVVGSIFMEVDVAPEQRVREVEWIDEIAADPHSGIVGIIGGARPEAENFEAELEAMLRPRLKGIRRVLHTQPDELSRTSRFRGNLRRLGERGLTYDLCFRASQLPVAAELLDACPGVSFVLDHCGVPDIASGAFEAWSADMGRLAERPNVACKISGLPTYCPPGESGPDTLRRWFERVVECFGWDRLVWGSDWPVCTLNGNLAEWSRTVETLLNEESEAHRRALFVDNARRVYGLE